MGNISRNCSLITIKPYYVVYKSLNNLALPYMRNMFQYVKDVCSTNLRSAASLKLYVPKMRPQSIQFSGPTIWNNLPPDARSAISLYVILSSFTQRTTKMSNNIISDCKLCIYCCALCCVLNSYRLYFVYIMLSVVCLMSVPCNPYILCALYIVYLNVCIL